MEYAAWVVERTRTQGSDATAGNVAPATASVII